MSMNKTGEEAMALLKEYPLGLSRTLDLTLNMMGSFGVEKDYGLDLYSRKVSLAVVLKIDVGDQGRREMKCTDQGSSKKWPGHRYITS